MGDTIMTALKFWEDIASENGWEVRSLTVWVDRDSKRIVDSVGINEGDGTIYVVDSETGEVTHTFEQWID